MDTLGSISVWIKQLKSGDRDAVRQLWHAYYRRLVALARIRLGARSRAAKDEEDVAASAFDSFFRAVENGRFPNLEDRDDLWQILVLLARRKAIHARRHETAQKRGAGKIKTAADFVTDDDAGSI